MWFALGIIVGILLAVFGFWLDKKYFVFSDLVFDLKTGRMMESESIFSDGEEETNELDIPRGKPISFKEWEKKHFKKHGFRFF